MSDELKVGAAAGTNAAGSTADVAANDAKRAEQEQQALTDGLAGNKGKSQVEEDTLTVTVENGESLSKLAKKYGVSVKEIMDLNEKQIKYFKSATDCDDNQKYAGFLVGAKIKLPAKANMKAVEENLKTTAEQERKKYEDSMKNLDTKLCDERTQSYKPMDENFRKQHNIRTKGEYEAVQNENPENPEGTAEQPELSDEEFREKYPYIARPDAKVSAYEPPKLETPSFKPNLPELEQKPEIQIPYRPADEADEPPAAEDKKDKPAAEVPSRPAPLKPDAKAPAYEPPKLETPSFKPNLPEPEQKPEIQIPYRPADETDEPPAAEDKKDKPAAEVQSRPAPLKPDDKAPAYEPQKLESPSFKQEEQAPDNVEQKNPSIQEMYDEAQKRKNANKPWWKFW